MKTNSCNFMKKFMMFFALIVACFSFATKNANALTMMPIEGARLLAKDKTQAIFLFQASNRSTLTGYRIYYKS